MEYCLTGIWKNQMSSSRFLQKLPGWLVALFVFITMAAFTQVSAMSRGNENTPVFIVFQ